ncbi:MAG TPA: 5'-3' exonuclease H3TH domain-containing protein [Gemmatimonadales bacterium]|nr:5'-3' exonuclease H3TH domain-containing protein [Gemmatimonadales bacterium]
MKVHLLDGTYELFRHFYAMPKQQDKNGREVAAIIGVLGSVLGMLEGGATHIGVATDHVIESFRNRLWAGYKTSEGIEPDLLAQFHPLEDALRAMGVVVWAMEEFEADDALAAAARLAAETTGVEQVIICTPDKDLSQCVVGQRVVQLDRRKRELRDEPGVVARFGVEPSSIPDYLALVGDSADGFPGVPGWGEKASGAVLGRYGHLERIPANAKEWEVPVRGAARLAAALQEHRDLALLFRTLATLRTDVPVGTVADLRWHGPTPAFERVARQLSVPGLWDRARRITLSD